MTGPMVRNKWGRTPAKGSGLREFLKMAMRPDGVSKIEVEMAGLWNSKCTTTAISSAVEVLRNQKGWDVRCFPAPHLRNHPQGQCPIVYKVVGKMKWNGGYRSFVKPKEEE